MITLVRTFQTLPGHQLAAIATAREIAAHLVRKHGAPMSVITPVGGNPFRIGYLVRYDDLATLERVMAAMPGDDELAPLIGRIGTHMVPGSSHDEIWRH